jgi:hypothetical protein
MGTDFADYDNDGWGDLVKGNFSNDTKNLYHNNRDGTFSDVTYAAGLADVGWLFTTFGTKFLDYDNDGWKDIFLANGQVFPNIDKYPMGITYAERNLLFHNRGNGMFDEVGLQSGPGLSIRKASRGVATADYDNDGDLEILVTNMNDTPDLLRHARRNSNHSILVKTIGTRSNRDGIGAEIRAVSGSLTQMDSVRSGGGYLSSSDLRVHFGFGVRTSLDRLEVHWPSGQTDTIQSPPVDHLLAIEEGKGLVKAETFHRPYAQPHQLLRGEKFQSRER